MILDKRIPLRYWVSLVALDVTIVSAFSLGIYFVSKHIIQLVIPINLGAFLGTAIALLLSFKLSQSYDRWWEARKIWGAIVNDSRTLVLQLKGFLSTSGHATLSAMAYRQMAWCYALGKHLRKENPLEGLDTFLSEEEVHRLKKHQNVPLALLDHQGQDLQQLHQAGAINDFHQIQLDSTLLRLCESMGKAERIKGTYFPKTYRQTLKLFIYIFLVMLSMSLTGLRGFIEVPLLVMISIPFFLLERIAFNMQDPFNSQPNDTAMTSIARNIEINIKQLLAEEEFPEPLSPERFYMM
ncbi:MAG TPA: hypothetical protein DCS93_01785 [Microscillaceae bacterium]|nr:hypothetical protein [Microscillaceae bacterium]